MSTKPNIQPAIVIIEDDPDIRMVLTATLERKGGYRVHGATSGLAGVKLVKSVKPCAVLLDFALPAFSGDIVLKTLKADPETADVPVFLMTGNRNVEHCLELGAEKILYKPFDVLDLLQDLTVVCRANDTELMQA